MNMYNNFMEIILDKYKIDEKEVDFYSPLVLAYVGDAVYEVFVRTMLALKGNMSVHNMHKKSISYVKAKAQSDIVHRLYDRLTDEEKDIVRRGRNSKSGTIPKNAYVSDYKYATGFESLIGYLYLKGRTERLFEILEMVVSGEVN